jgi:hypothetical protein
VRLAGSDGDGHFALGLDVALEVHAVSCRKRRNERGVASRARVLPHVLKSQCTSMFTTFIHFVEDF